MRRLGKPNTTPTSAVMIPATGHDDDVEPGKAKASLYVANAPTAMNPPVPSESCPAYPVRMLSPSAASANTRNGIMMVSSQYSLASSGTAM